ncbi:hypothetical protein BVY03_02030 [bacterium K02(2017)]|nr:hypothetical protein BVY03_02030 [bacterium K02(2017)]
MKNHIYIHFPYCLYKCHYCDFNSHARSPQDIPYQKYTETLIKEIDTQIKQEPHRLENKTIHSIYFGGGTPSLMPATFVFNILNTLERHFTFTNKIEITLEANPGTLNKDKLNAFKEAGINRISMGIQSLNDNYLKRFGRIHSAQEAKDAITLLQEVAFPKWSVDLIFGFPNQTNNEWKSDLSYILKTDTNHFSCYALTNEPGTHYTQQIKRGQILPTPDDQLTDMLKLTYELSDKAGFTAYEISNFAKGLNYSEHNLGYWHYENFWGWGAGAWGQSDANNNQGNIFLLRTHNADDPHEYQQQIELTGTRYTEEVDYPTAMFEYVMMGLRLKSGISIPEFNSRFNQGILNVFESGIKFSIEKGWLEHSGDRLMPTFEGFIFNNAMVSSFIQD